MQDCIVRIDIFQPNYERNPMEEMRAAEAAGKFHYIPPGIGVDDEVTREYFLQPLPGTDILLK
jgi:hypothetical protein